MISDPHAYIHALGDACVVVGADLCVLAGNAAAEHLYVFAHGTLRGTCMTELCDADEIDAVRTTLQSLGGAPRRFTVRQRCGDGSTFLADITAKRFHGPGGALAVLTVRHRKATGDPADLWMRSELLDLGPDALHAYTAEGELIYANAAARGLWSVDSTEDMRRRGPWAWIAPDERDRLAHRLNLLLDEGEIYYESCRSYGIDSKAHCEVYERVVHTTRGQVIIASTRDISNRRMAEAEVRYLAYHDTLTGLANRLLFQQELAHALSAAERHDDIVGIVYLDLDDFKPVNDTHGHAVGDNVLRRVAERITSCVRLTDTVARFGGDEFVVLVPRLRTALDLPDVARKIADEIEKPMWLSDVEINVSCSMGLAIHVSGESISDLMDRADQEMYRSRETGVPGWLMAV